MRTSFDIFAELLGAVLEAVGLLLHLVGERAGVVVLKPSATGYPFTLATMRWGVLRHRPFALLFTGQAISSLGDRLVPVALAFAVLDITGSVTDLGLVLAAQTLPLLLLVLVGGVWADRLPRQRVMLVSDAVRAAAQGLSAAIVLSGSARIWELAALQAIYGSAEAFFGPASRVVAAQTVDQDELQQANALIGLSAELTSVLGPALAGVIVVAASPGWALAIDAATFVVSAICLALLRIKLVVVAERKSTLAELRAGWRTFRSRTWLWATVLFFTLFIGFVFAPWQVLAPQISLRRWAAPAPGRQSTRRSDRARSAAPWSGCDGVLAVRCAPPSDCSSSEGRRCTRWSPPTPRCRRSSPSR